MQTRWPGSWHTEITAAVCKVNITVSYQLLCFIFWLQNPKWIQSSETTGWLRPSSVVYHYNISRRPFERSEAPTPIPTAYSGWITALALSSDFETVIEKAFHSCHCNTLQVEERTAWIQIITIIINSKSGVFRVKKESSDCTRSSLYWIL